MQAQLQGTVVTVTGGAVASTPDCQQHAHPIKQTTTPAPASGGGSPPSCSSAPAIANAPGSLMLFQVVSIQPSERWTWDMRNASMWPLKGSAISGYVPADAEGSCVEIDRQRIAHLRPAVIHRQVALACPRENEDL